MSNVQLSTCTYILFLFSANYLQQIAPDCHTDEVYRSQTSFVESRFDQGRGDSQEVDAVDGIDVQEEVQEEKESEDAIQWRNARRRQQLLKRSVVQRSENAEQVRLLQFFFKQVPIPAGSARSLLPRCIRRQETASERGTKK